jgi:hypothetical protein
MTDLPRSGLCAVWLKFGAHPPLDRVERALRRRVPPGALRTYLSLDGDNLLLLASTESTTTALQLSRDAAVSSPEATSTAYRFVCQAPRSAFEVADGPFLWVIQLSAPPPNAARIRDWFHGEHFERQVETSGILGCRAYETVEEPHQFLNIWSITDPGVPTSREYGEMRATSWAERLEHDFAASTATRVIFRPARIPNSDERTTADRA